MTLQEFLLKNGRVDLNIESTIKAHIRQHVQNIDVLASKEMRDMAYKDIRDIYMAILLDNYPQRAFWVDDALNLFVEDAHRIGLSDNEIKHIVDNTGE